MRAEKSRCVCSTVNFGHWDIGNSKDEYQSNLREIVKRLKRTGAKLIWVTTTPVPNGFKGQGAGMSLGTDGRIIGNLPQPGIMKRFLNPWAMEVIGKEPMEVVDLWHFVTKNEDGIFTEWWAGRDIHFPWGTPVAALGHFVGAKIEKVVRAGNRSMV